MRVERDGHVAEFDEDEHNLTVYFLGEVQMTERQLDNFLQFVLLGVGLDVKHQDPPDPEPTRPEIPEPEHIK